MTLPIFHSGDHFPISIGLKETDTAGVLVQYPTAGVTFQVALVTLDRSALVLGPVNGTATATGCTCLFDRINTIPLAAGVYRVEVQADNGGILTSWSDSMVQVEKGWIG